MDDKQHIRLAIRAQRARRSDADRHEAGRLIARCSETIAPGGGPRAGDVLAAYASVVAAYAAVGDEPPTRELRDALVAHSVRVLLPVVSGADLDWADYEGWGSLTRTDRGLLEPSGARLGTDALADVRVVVVPALAVDRRGRRLGRGAGFYDRALEHVDGRLVTAVVYDDEILDEIPAEQHDQPVSAALTPSGLVVLGQ